MCSDEFYHQKESHCLLCKKAHSVFKAVDSQKKKSHHLFRIKIIHVYDEHFALARAFCWCLAS